MTTNETKKIIPEFKSVKKISPFVADQFNNRGGKSGGKKLSTTNTGVRKMNVMSNLKKGGGGDR